MTHTFPTRRSSDLLEIVGDLVADLAVELTIGFLVDAQGPRRRPVGETEIPEILLRAPAVRGARGKSIFFEIDLPVRRMFRHARQGPLVGAVGAEIERKSVG